MPLPRVCQFFLRGRCQRGEKCDFSHVMPTNASSATATTANGSKDVAQPINSSTTKSSSLPGERETFITPKVRYKISIRSVDMEITKMNYLTNINFIEKIHLNLRYLSLIPKATQTVTTSL